MQTNIMYMLLKEKKQNKTYQINDFYFNKRTNISTQHVQDEFIVF